MISKDDLGDRMKFFENQQNSYFVGTNPVLTRIDGRSFSKFTSGLAKPYDERLSRLMIETTKFLVEQTNARCGYTQSDEISLVFFVKENEELFFGGKLSKIISIISSLTTAYFNKLLPNYLPEKSTLMPVFDNRAWEVPFDYEASNYFIWREQDAIRNSIQGAARFYYSHSDCLNKNGLELQEMLLQKGVNWENYPRFFRQGTYVRKRILERPFTAEELQNLPPKHLARTNPEALIQRTVVIEEDFPPLVQMENRTEVILLGKDPKIVPLQLKN